MAAPLVPALQLHTEIDRELTALYERALPWVVRVNRGRGNGAGTIWRSDGLVVTNAHVVESSPTVRIVLSDDRQFEGRVMARDTAADLALVEIDATDLPAPAIGDSTRIKPGQLVFAIGHPHGQVNLLTAGIVVSACRSTVSGETLASDLVRIDARIAPGSSGGPVIGVDGCLLGISTRVAGHLSMAIPSATVERFAAGLVPGYARVYLGMNGVIATLPRGPQSAGFVVTEIVSETPAARAGLLLGDVILSIAGTPIVDQESIPAAMLRVHEGEDVELELTRGGQPHSLRIVPAERMQP